MGSWCLGSADASPAWNKMLKMLSMLYVALQTSAWQMWQVWFIFSDFISLLGCFRGISAKSSKQYYLKFPGKYFFLLTIFRMDLFRAAHGLGCKNDHLHKICHTYPTMMKLSTVTPYLTKIQNIYKHVTHLLSFADISMFSPKITRTFVISRNTDIDCISIYNC